MFQVWGSWLGSRAPGYREEEEEEEAAAAEGAGDTEGSGVKTEAGSAHGYTAYTARFDAAPWTRALGGYVYDFASNATKRIVESVTETAQTFKKSVDTENIDNIIDKTILGDFQKEQKRFVEEKKSRTTSAAVPPWVGTNDEETIQQQILALSADRRNFLRDPPAGIPFHFDLDQMYPVALVMLQEDQLLRMMRFDLVPKHVKEDVFWRNYFYRISLIKQSAQLSELAAQQEATRREKAGRKDTNLDGIVLTENIGLRIPPMTTHSQNASELDESISTSPGMSEFVSDTFDLCSINQEDLQKDMEQLVLDKKDTVAYMKRETADWERELQQELDKYEVVTDFQSTDDSWDREIEEMLKADC
ncbi:synapse-associated protein 1-like [Scleropages formosus]|uniref:Synapse-associated protein 1 n=1 Tax=Scleropages formosus TaxID=113540 RepID=A0A0P7UVJ5_SCLFO|nr:synapse-associated protein 1-like [Scleropages formosus]